MDFKSFILGNAKIESQKTATYKNSIQEFLPISDVKDGIIITKDNRYVKLLEVLPVNFYLKSDTEKQNIIYYFASYLKVAPDNLQIKIITQKADINSYSERMWEYYDNERNEKCKEMIEDNITLVNYLSYSEAVARRFFLIFQLENHMKLRTSEFKDIIMKLREVAETARKYLDFCGLEIVRWENEDEEIINLLHSILNKKTSKNTKLTGLSKNMIGEIGCIDYDNL